MEVQELMRVHVNSITPDAALPDAVDMMDLYQVVIIPVVDEESRPIGVVSESDIEEALLIPFNAGASDSRATAAERAERMRLSARAAREIRIREIMSVPPVTVDEHTDVLEAASMLQTRGLKRIPVTSDGRLIGTIGRIEVSQAILEIYSS